MEHEDLPEDEDTLFLQSIAYGGETYVSAASIINYMSQIYEEATDEVLEKFLIQFMADLDILHEETTIFYPDLSDMIDNQKLEAYVDLQRNAEERNG